MKAAIYREFGAAADVLSVVDIDVPEPGPGQVRVRVTRSAINPTDWKSRSGSSGRPIGAFQIPHHDGAGVVDALGAGVDDRRVGQRVWLFGAAMDNPYGTAAEYCVVPAGRAVPLPDDASDDLGACLGVTGVTAAPCLGPPPAARRPPARGRRGRCRPPGAPGRWAATCRARAATTSTTWRSTGRRRACGSRR